MSNRDLGATGETFEAVRPFFDPQTHLVTMCPEYVVDRQLVHHVIVDRHLSMRDKAAKIAAHTCNAFAEQVGIDPGELPNEEEFGRDYFALAKCLKDKEGRPSVSCVLDDMDELTDSHRRFSPLGVAKFIEDIDNLSEAPKLARLMTALWYVQCNPNPELLSTAAAESLRQLSERPHPTAVAKYAS